MRPNTPIARSLIAIGAAEVTFRSIMMTRHFPGFLRQIVVAFSLLLVGLSSAVAQVAVSTLAGSSPAIQSGNVEGTGTAARFNALTSVAVDNAGNIYVADAANHTIRKVTAAGVVTTLAGSGAQGNANGTGGSASFRFPQGVATDNTNIYVADTFNHAIRQIVITTGVVTTLAGTVGTSGTTNATGVAARFNNPLGLAVSGTDLYVADTSNHSIRKIVIGTGVVTTLAGTAATGTAGTPGFADGTGVAATFRNPGAIAAEGTTNLYVADTANHTIRKIVIAGGGVVTTLAGTGNGTGGSTDSAGAAASFKSPGGLVVSGANLFVADTGNNIIRQIVHATGVVTTIAGTAGAIGTTDAIGTAARFQGPTGIGVSAGGTLYIANTNNHTLRTGGVPVAPTVSNPASATVYAGTSVTFTISATGSPSPTIQWERQPANTVGFTAIATSATYTGASTATLTVTNATLAMTGDQFRASVTNGIGAAVSATPATLTVQMAPTITSAAATNFSLNTAGTFTVTATGSPAPTFSVAAGTFPPWASLNATTGVISGTPTNNTGSPFTLTIHASNGVGSAATQSFTLAVSNIPIITAISAPRQVVAIGQNLTLHVTVVSGSTPTYQWKRNGFPIPGATSASFTINGAAPLRDNGWYQVVATNSNGSTVSSTIFVAVSLPTAVFAWGDNTSGQGAVPAGITNAIAVSAGYSHNLALKADGSVVAWGYNVDGRATVPAGLTGVVAVAAGSYHSVALKSDGTVVAWGSVSAPSDLTAVVAVAAGDYHTLALKSDGTVISWGVAPESNVPVGLSGVVAVAAGNRHSLALKSDGTVVGWGLNNSGQATSLATESGLVAIAAGYFHNLAIKADGSVIGGLAGTFSAISARGSRSLGLNSQGHVIAWGSNFWGESTVPSNLGGVIAIAAGGAHSLALHDARSDSTPVVTTPLVNRSANVGEVVTFGGAASFGPTIAPQTYQWRKAGANIPNATLASYMIDGVSPSDAGSYDVVVANYLGSITSAAATLTVNAAPVVSATGSGRYVLSTGQNLTLALDAAINSSAIVQWKRSGFAIAGATARTFTISNASHANSGYYQAVFNEGSGPVVSAPIFVLVAPSAIQLVGWGSVTSSQLSFPAQSPRFVAMAANSFSNVALRIDGTIANWGGYSPPEGLGNVVAVSAGLSHFLALKIDGTVVQWGNSSNGQGNPPTDLSNVVSIASGRYHNLALRSDGTVVAWGDPSYGGTAVPSALTGVAAVSAGAGFSLALKQDGTVVGWGNNGSGQSSPPAALANIIALSAGNNFSLALKSDGTVAAWGASGTGSVILPLGLSGIVAVSAGDSHALALRANGSLIAWGTNNSGQTSLPAGLNSVFALAAGYSHSLALRDSSGDITPVVTAHPVGVTAFGGQAVSFTVGASGGTALLSYQWRKGGIALSGATSSSLALSRITSADAGSYDVVVTNQMGTTTSQPATLTFNSTPAVVLNLTGRQVIAPGQNLLLTATAAIVGPVTYQWRRNGRAIAGAADASLLISAASRRDTGAYQVVASNGVGPVVSAPVFVAVTQPSQIVAWGDNGSGQLAVPAMLTDAMAISAGSNHSLALKSDGSVVAWGGNTSYQINIPPGLSGVVAIAARSGYSLALRSDGTVATWGAINYTPTGLNSVVSVAAGGDYAMALRQDGTVAAWTALNVATDLPAGLADVVAISAGGSHRLALKSDGKVVAWGNDSYGQSSVPAGLSNLVEIAAGDLHSLALKSDGSVVAWGRSQDGQTAVPVGLAGVISIAASGYTSFALKSDGTVVAWGNYNYSLSLLPPRLSQVFAVAGGDSHALALRDSAADAAPVITASPSNQIATFGQTVSISVSATGTPTPSYQWRVNGSALSGATSATYTLTNAQSYHAGSYDVVVSNYLGTATSSAATLVVGSAPSLFGQPVSQSVGTGGTVQLSVSVGGTSPFSYQWRRNSVALSGATAATLRLTNFQPADAGAYDVVVTSALGTVTSTVATLSSVASTPPTITSQPVGGSLFAGNVAAFSVSFSGSGTFYPQWRKDGVAIPGATNSNYIQGNSQPSFSGVYDVVVASIGGSVTSSPATLLVVTNPGFVTHPLSQAVGSGGTVLLTATAIGDLPLSYQWRKDGVPLAGATTTSLRVSDFLAAAVYDAVVTNTAGSSTSSAASLTLAGGTLTPPTITTHPVGATVDETNNRTFTVAATGTGPLFYQWRKNSAAISGATNPSLALTAITPSNAGTYDVVASNLSGAITSTAAVLNVTPIAITFSVHPANTSVYVGAPAVLTVAATGVPSVPSYQWRKNGVSVGTGSSFAFTSAQLADAGSYDVVATNTHTTATSNAATLTVIDAVPAITLAPVGATLAIGGNVTLTVAAVGSVPFTYQWRRDGVSILGATLASLPVANAQTYQAGFYTVVVTNALGSATSAAARLNVIPRVVAYSARLQIDAEGAVAVFTIEGALPKKVLLRAVGPGLAPYGFSGLPDPQLELFNAAGTLLAINNDWASSADAAAISTTTAAVGAFALTIGSRDSAVLATLAPGTYTVRAKPASGPGGTGYLELYDADLATEPLSTLPYVAVRGRMGAGGGVVIGGLGSNGRGQRSYLVRAVGPTLGLPGALANPAMLIVRDGTLVGSNDDWDANATDATATTTALARVAAFPLPAGGRDAALVLTGNLHAGSCTVQVGGSDALGGTVLLELHDLDAARPTTFSPAIASAPVHTTVATGEATALRVLAHGTAPLSYQWRKDGIPLDGATTATLSLASVQPSQGGSYTVFVSNSIGTATSLSAVLTVQSGGSGSGATQAVVGNGYAAGGTATITNTLTYSTTPTGLGWKVTLPVGWSFVSDAGTLGDVRPLVGTVGALEWAWSTPPTSPVTFSYTVNVPAGTAGEQFIAASGIVRFGGSLSLPIATPSPLLVAQITTHSADTNADYRVGLLELTRVIELYNTRLGTTRTGRYLIQDGSEDGYGLDATTPAGAPVTIARFHSADSNRNANLSLVELTRVIELYNTYSGTMRTGAYHVLAGTEDGFAPGP